MKRLPQFAPWLFAILLRLYPRHFQEEFGEEITAVFQQHVQESAAHSSRDALAVIGRELRDWPLNCLREHARERNRQLNLPRPTFFSGWGAIAAAVPFLINLSFMVFSINASRFLLIAPILIGIVVAWWHRWPGWVASWLGVLIFFGQSLLPYSLLEFANDLPWNSVPRLLHNLSEVLIQVGWLLVLYWILHRWPRHGVLVFLQFLFFPWWFSMEFASDASTSVIFFIVNLLVAVTAVAIAKQRTLTGDIWLVIIGGSLLPGLLLSWGGMFFSPGTNQTMGNFLPELLMALSPYLLIILLQVLNMWGEENGRLPYRRTRIIFWGSWLTYFAVIALTRLIAPSDLEAFRLSVSPLLIGLWLVGLLMICWSLWQLRSTNLPKLILLFYGLMLFALPLLYRAMNLSHLIRSLTYNKPDLAHIQALLPVFETADLIVFNSGFIGLLAFPLVIGRVRLQTDAFPKFPPSTSVPWWRRRWKQRDTNARNWSWRKRLSFLFLAVGLVAGGLFSGLVFIPLQLEAEPYTQQVALGDIDGDGDLDVLLANTRRLIPNADNFLFLNEGNGRFKQSEQFIGIGSNSAIMFDSDTDGDLDIVTGGMGGPMMYENQENGRFFARRVNMLPPPESGINTLFFQVGDLNADGLSDLFVAGCCGLGESQPGQTRWIPSANRVLLASENSLVDSGQALGTSGSEAIDLGDVDGDGDLDAFVGNTQENGDVGGNDLPNEVWINDGSGIFNDSGQSLGQQRTYAVALGDVDGDGDVDALVGNEGADELWLNNGNGRFRRTAQRLSNLVTLTVTLVDLDNDGDLDAVTGHERNIQFAWWRQGIIWWNDGTGQFSQHSQHIRYRPNGALAVGDINDDNLPDIVVGELDKVTVWLNGENGRFSRLPSE